VLVAAKQAAEQAQEAAKGERGRLVIGSQGAATISFLTGVLSRFREQHPLVEITLLRMNNRAQVEAVLNGSIMVGIGYYRYALVHQVRDWFSGVAIKMGRRQGATKEHI
jgi:DNA-binding transcriptional LysR family regulator